MCLCRLFPTGFLCGIIYIFNYSIFFIIVALGVQQPSLLGASPSVYSQQSALAAVSLSNQSAANYQLSQQTAALQQQAAAAAAAALQQVSQGETQHNLCIGSANVNYLV